MMPRVSGLGTRFPLALALSAARSRLPSKSIRRRWLGRVSRVLFPPCQLPLQIRDLLFGVSDLLFGVSDLLFGVSDLLLGVSDLLLAFRNLLFAFGYFTS